MAFLHRVQLADGGIAFQEFDFFFRLSGAQRGYDPVETTITSGFAAIMLSQPTVAIRSQRCRRYGRPRPLVKKPQALCPRRYSPKAEALNQKTNERSVCFYQIPDAGRPRVFEIGNDGLAARFNVENLREIFNLFIKVRHIPQGLAACRRHIACGLFGGAHAW